MKVYDIGNFFLRNFVFETAEGLVLMDANYPDKQKTLLKKLQKIADGKALKYIFLTHHHDDHAGCLNEVLKMTGATLVLHKSAVDRIALGDNFRTETTVYPTKFIALTSATKKTSTFEPVVNYEKSVVLKDESDQFFEERGIPLKIVFLPGHTADSIALIDTETNILYAGDAVMNMLINPNCHPLWIEDPSLFAKTLEKIVELAPSLIVPSHGSPITVEKIKKNLTYLEGRKLYPVR